MKARKVKGNVQSLNILVFFSEAELLRIIDCILSALMIFKHAGIKHGFI